MTFTNNHISIAGKSDIVSIEKLLNQAYRGDTSKQGWTTEANIIGGMVRTTSDTIEQLMEQQCSIFAKYVNEQNIIVGCVNLQVTERGIYLGMLAVEPLQQAAGVGKQLLAIAVEYANANNCNRIFMTVISIRTELIAWYMRHGYVDTGQRTPFNEDGISGNHLQPLEFMVLEKQV